MTRLDLIRTEDIMLDGIELYNISVALKITPSSGLAPQKDPIMYQYPAVIMTGNYRGLEVTIRSTATEALFDSLDGTLNPLLLVSGTLVRKCVHDRCTEHGFFFLVSVAHDLLDCLCGDNESVIENLRSHL